MMVLMVVLNGEKLEAKILKKIHERMIKSFMDIIIMSELKNAPLSGYDVIAYIKSKFSVLVSSGTVYSLLYSLERNGFVEGVWVEKKRTYKLTEKGEKTIATILNAHEKIEGFMSNLLRA